MQGHLLLFHLRNQNLFVSSPLYIHTHTQIYVYSHIQYVFVYNTRDEKTLVRGRWRKKIYFRRGNGKWLRWAGVEFEYLFEFQTKYLKGLFWRNKVTNWLLKNSRNGESQVHVPWSGPAKTSQVFRRIHIDWTASAIVFKGTVARDFRPLVFFMGWPHMVPWFTP